MSDEQTKLTFSELVTKRNEFELSAVREKTLVVATARAIHRLWTVKKKSFHRIEEGAIETGRGDKAGTEVVQLRFRVTIE